MKKSCFSFTFTIVCLSFIYNSLFALNYFIDFERGKDSNSGLDPLNSWKHCPGDSNATGNADITLSPGDNVYFKGGVVYRGKVTVNASGTSGNVITFTTASGWGTGQAIIDGSEIVTATWTQCTQASDCDGNSDYTNIWYAYITEADDAFLANLHENDTRLFVTQYPVPTDPRNDRDTSEYIAPDTMTTTYLEDTDIASYGGAYLVGSSVYSREDGNRIHPYQITAYDFGNNRITYETMSAAVHSTPLYALGNWVGHINEAGKYACETTAEVDGTYQVFLWPHNSNPNNQEITISVRGNGFVCSGRSYFKIDNLIIQKMSGSGATGDSCGIALYSTCQNYTISNCTIQNNMHNDAAYGGIYAYDSRSSTIKKNTIKEIMHGRGIAIVDGDDMTVQNNVLTDVGGTYIYGTSGLTNSAFIGNSISGYADVHGNGMSFYSGCNQILIANNRVIYPSYSLTFNHSSNIVVYNNVFDGMGSINYVVKPWSATTGVNFLLNNTIVGSNNKNVSVNFVSTNWTCRNNIIDGGNPPNTTNHLYVGLAYFNTVDPPYNWTANPGDVIGWNGSGYVAIDPTTVFVDYVNEDYMLKSNSPAIARGTNLYPLFSSINIVERFPKYQFSLDMNGNERPENGNWSIGSFEYIPNDNDIIINNSPLKPPHLHKMGF